VKRMNEEQAAALHAQGAALDRLISALVRQRDCAGGGDAEALLAASEALADHYAAVEVSSARVAAAVGGDRFGALGRLQAEVSDPADLALVEAVRERIVILGRHLRINARVFARARANEARLLECLLRDEGSGAYGSDRNGRNSGKAAPGRMLDHNA
jgi:hypothetical protein